VVRSSHGRLREASMDTLNQRLDAMQAEARAVVAPAARGAGIDEHSLRVERLAELRYEGQGHELRIAVPDGVLNADAVRRMLADFEVAYQRNYGVTIPGAEVEVVTWSVTVSSAAAAVTPATLPPSAATPLPIGTRPVWDPATGQTLAFAQHWRFDLPPGARLAGPALVVEHETTTLVPPGWTAQVDSLGHLHLQRPHEEAQA
jgi:N-methylhydantoinase A